MSRPVLAINAGSCSRAECGRKAECRGLCGRHYSQLNYIEHDRASRGHQEARVFEIGDIRLNTGGYVEEKVGLGRSWRLRHRLVMECTLGRLLLDTENVHHINGQKMDNRPENLELWVTKQPKGQRVVDLLEFAQEIIQRYGAAA